MNDPQDPHPPKDLFVELSRLQSSLGTLTATALTLRNAILTRPEREDEIERTLLAQLQAHATATQQLAADIRTEKAGISFISEELHDPAPPPQPTPSARRTPSSNPRPNRQPTVAKTGKKRPT